MGEIVLPKPTYEEKGIQLYLGDCLEIMKSIPDKSVDLCLCDPPYGVKVDKWDSEIPKVEFLLECFRISKGATIWFGGQNTMKDVFKNYPPPEKIIIWHTTFSLSPVAKNGMYYRWHPLYCWGLPKKQNILHRDVIEQNCDGHNWWNHKGTKPIKLMRTLVEAFSQKENSILDPFMGSGTTGVAAKELGRKFIGIEIEPKYFEIAQRRINQTMENLL